MTPPSLASQWADELSRHAPTLKVFIYEGWSKLAPLTRVKNVRITEKGKDGSQNSGTAEHGNSSSSSKEWSRAGSNVDQSQLAGGRKARDWCSFIQDFDVCITTYTALRRDFNVACAPPIRPRRDCVNYSSPRQLPRSPLIMCEWYRVIMDEVQMVRGGNTE